METVLTDSQQEEADVRFDAFISHAFEDIELYGKWFRGYFYFCAKYACPGPGALSPFFEARFARLEYAGEQGFNLAFMRHTDQWIETEQGLTLDQCLNSMRKDELYQP